MSTREELADALAHDVIEAMEATGHEKLWEEVAKEIGITSPTTQEAFVTAMRIRLAERRGRKFLEERLAAMAKANRPG